MAPPPDHAITSTASLLRLAWILCTHPTVGLLFLRVLWTTWTRFFLPQYRPWRTGRTRQVAMKLDALFHYDPAWYPCYMGFTRLWMGSLGWLHGRFGRRSVPDIVAFLVGLESLFLEAHKVYARCQSTMSQAPARPAGTPLAIRLFDPNLHCFPSTHVMIVAFNAYRMADILERLKEPHEDYSAESAFLLDQARRVVESIVHVKQHSLADIAPAFLLLDSLGFGPAREGVEEFLDGLFPHLPEEHAASVRVFLKAAHERLDEERCKGKPLVAVLVAFLDDYEREMEALLSAAATEDSKEVAPISIIAEAVSSLETTAASDSAESGDASSAAEASAGRSTILWASTGPSPLPPASNPRPPPAGWPC
jgi:hypothetical protein